MRPAFSIVGMRVLVVEDEPYLAEAIRDGLRLEAIAVLTAADRLDDNASGFGLGADDFVTKPGESRHRSFRSGPWGNFAYRH